jgi:hypothetical protein
LATSGIFFPPKSKTATPRITNNSGKPIVSINKTSPSVDAISVTHVTCNRCGRSRGTIRSECRPLNALTGPSSEYWPWPRRRR